jgi:hypothetical protein
MATEITVTYTHEVPTTLPPEAAGSFVIPRMQTTANLNYTARKIFGVWLSRTWANDRAWKIFTKLETFSTEAFRDAHQRFSEMDA